MTTLEPLTTARRTGAWAQRLPFALLGLLAALSIAFHVSGIGGAFLSDDFTHLGWIFEASDHDALGAWTLARFVEPLGNGTYAWRPIAFASYVLDWLVWGTAATGWHLTNLLIHAGNAIFAGRLVVRWTPADTGRAKLAGVIAATILIAFPFAGETSYWPVGRFDLLAAFFSLLCLSTIASDAAPGSPATHALRLLWFACALLSKESALPLPIVATLLATAFAWTNAAPGASRGGQALRSVARETGPIWIMFALYLALRQLIFGSSFKVYPHVAAAFDPADLLFRVGGISSVVREIVGPAAVVWSAAALILVAAILGSSIVLRRRMTKGTTPLALALAAGTLAYVLAPSFSIPVFAPYGEGGRHAYLAWVYLALLCGTIQVAHRGQWLLAIALVAVALVAQQRSLAQWQTAGARMKAVVAAIAPFTAAIPADRYALLLLPDHLGIAPFARDAQAALMMRPTQHRDATDRAVVTLGADLRDWSAHLASDTVAKFKGVAHFDPANFDGLYCFDPERSAIVRLTPGEVWRDADAWQALAARNFSSVGCLPPFE